MLRPRLTFLITTLALVGLAACSSTTDGGGAGTPTATGPATVPGTFVYVPEKATEDNSEAALLLWSAAGPAVREGAKIAGGEALGSATISPDGKRVAFIHDARHDGTGDLTVANLADGGRPTVVLKGVDLNCTEPVWSGDNAKVIAQAQPGDKKLGSVDVASAAFTAFPFPFEGCHAMWSGNGKVLAYSNGEGSIIVTNVDGTNRHEVPRLAKDGGPTRRRSYDLISLSPDGKYLALFVNTGDNPDGDVARGVFANEVVDTTTGETRTLPFAGELQYATFVAGGGLVARVKTGDTMSVVALSPEFTVRATADEPMQLATAILVGYGSP